MIDISDLLNKRDNAEQQQYIEEQGIPAEETLPAEEFVNKIVKPIRELQDADAHNVKKIVRGSYEYTPVNGVITLPGEGVSVQIFTTASRDQIISVTGQVIIPIAITSVENGTDTAELVDVTVERRENDQWAAIPGTLTVATTPYQNMVYTNLDISSKLMTGNQEIRLSAKGRETGVTGRITFTSIVLTELKLEFATDYNTPVDVHDQEAASRTLSPAYYIYGSGVFKTLHLKISGKKRLDGTKGYREKTIDIGYDVYNYSAYNQIALTDTGSDDVLIMTHGVHEIEAWLSCNDINGTTYTSEHIFNQLMIIVDNTDTTPYLMLQDVKTNAVNYEQATLLKYAVYNPSGNTDIAVSIQNYGGSKEYLRVENSAESQTKYEVVSTIEADDETGTEFYAYLVVYRYLNGTQYNFIQESLGVSEITITVDNSENFAPTTGVDFYLNPKTRNNSEVNPATIVNAANNQVLSGAVFQNFGFVNDGWVSDDDGVKILRIMAGQTLTIPYEPWQHFINTPASSMTLEFDMKIKNVTDEQSPIIKCYNEVAGGTSIKGLLMRPLDGYIKTASAVTEKDQNFAWMEDERVHIAINVVHALKAAPDSPELLSLVRVFVNNNLNREFNFAKEAGEFINNGGHGGIIIGQDEADIDIYSIRCYRKALSTSDIQKDYVATLRTSAEKIAYRNKNAIMQDGLINYLLAKQKYNTMVWHGTEVYRMSTGKQFGWLEITKLNADGTIDLDHSGKICEATKSLPCKGQGSTAKTYYYWNQQYDIKDIDPSATIEIPAEGGGTEEVTDGWIDGHGTYRGTEYVLSDSAPKMKKAVLKINYASSMQSHKEGATGLYNDLHTAIVGKNTMQLASPKARVCVYEEPFLFFVQGENDSAPVFRGLGTFGSGKMDEPTWGFDKSTHKDFMMLEGSDNNKPLTDMRVPWEDSKVTWNAGEEYYEYAGEGNIDLDKTGSKNADGSLKPSVLEYPKDAWNFLFMHNPMIKPYLNQSGGANTFGNFVNDASIPDSDKVYQFWMPASDGNAGQYELFRWDVVDGAWVHAGMPDEYSSDGYAIKNLLTIYPNALDGVPAGNWARQNEAFIRAIVADAKANIGSYFKVDSLKFHYAFVNHFLAGTDNCSKNTYYVLDPTTHLFELHQDDLDTIFKTDNSGYQVKPYYVDRMHPYDENGVLQYTEGTNNVLFNLCEMMYEKYASPSEIAPMLRSILTGMGNLMTEADLDAERGINRDAWGCLHKYFFSIQEYFPDCAYNETARIRYEYPASLNYVSDRNVRPIAQSLGSQLLSEMQYMKRRLVYMSSFAAYGEFSLDGANGFGFTTHARRGDGYPTVVLNITPHQYIYPTARVGQTLVDPHVRLSPGQTYRFEINTSGTLGDTVCGLKGGDYYRSFGNLADLSLDENLTFQISGKRLVEVVATSEGLVEFRTSTLSINAPLVKTINIKNADMVSGMLNLTNLTRLRSVNVEGTAITQVRLPASELLHTVKLGSGIETLVVANVPNLTTLTLTGYSQLSTVNINCRNSSFNSLAFAQAVYAAAPSGLQSVSFLGVDWTTGSNLPSPAMIMWFVNRQSCQMTGAMTCPSAQGTFSFTDKKLLAEKFGDIDSSSNPLYILYNVTSITDIGIYGEKYLYEDICTKVSSNPDVYEYDGLSVQPLAILQNDVAVVGNRLDIEWSMESNAYATIDSQTGVVTITDFSSPQYQNYAVTAKVRRKSSGEQLSVSRVIGFYRRVPKLGDFAYLDGTFDDVYDSTKDLAGIVYARNWYKSNPDTVTANNDPLRYVKVNGVYVIDPEAKYMRLYIVAKEFMQAAYQETFPVNYDMEWGLFNDETDGDNGFPASTLADMLQYINTTYGTSYTSAFDLAALTNRGNSGIGNYGYADLIQSSMSSDEDYEYGGFNKAYVVEKDTTLNRTYAIADWNGRKNTEEIVSYADKVFEWVKTQPGVASVSHVPQTLAELASYMRKTLFTELAPAGNTQTKYYQFAYPAAYACHLYEPSHRTGAFIDDQYVKGKWYLPALGELLRLFHHFNISRNSPRTSIATGDNTAVPDKAYANYDETEGKAGIDAWNPVFARALKRLNDGGAAPSLFVNLTASGYRSSTEVSAYNAWHVNFYSGHVYIGGKYNRSRVRAVTAYLFNIL